MNPETVFCHNPQCPARGRQGAGNIGVLSRKEPRYRCKGCGVTFVARKGTVWEGLRKPEALVTCVLTLLAHSCPVQAIVVAFGLDERTVAAWQRRAGQHCQRVHEHWVEGAGVVLGHVQADELRVKAVGQGVWLASAMMVSTRLWWGGVVRRQRDRHWILVLMQRVRACCGSLPQALLLCVDGLASEVSAFQKVFREPIQSGQRGRPRRVAWPQITLGQVIQHRFQRRVVAVTRQVAFGSALLAQQLLHASGNSQVLGTAFIERLNATFRAHRVILIRKGRALAHQIETVEAGMWWVGCAYHGCWAHDSLRLRLPEGSPQCWQERTPAMATGLTDHCWRLDEIFRWVVPLPPLPVRKRRGRPPIRQVKAKAA